MPAVILAVLTFWLAAGLVAGPRSSVQQAVGQEPPHFRTDAAFIYVSVAVTDMNGHFVTGLRDGDFLVEEDGRPQPITQFSVDRVPVSVGLALDTSGSMAGEKMTSARRALARFFDELSHPEDEFFLYQIATNPRLVEGWTGDRDRLRAALGRLPAEGSTALCDTIDAAIPYAEKGSRPRKALVVISDGNDTSSSANPVTLRKLLRGTEVLVYAIGIDGSSRLIRRAPAQPPVRRPPTPWPRPGGIGGRWPGSLPPRTPMPIPPTAPDPGFTWSEGDRVNVPALRELTDASGGRTEIVRTAQDLQPTTSGIAAELVQQYFIGYRAAAPNDGRWHTIKVQVKSRRDVTVRARQGYNAASPSPSERSQDAPASREPR